MQIRDIKIVALLVVALAAGAACDGDEESFDRNKMLEETAQNVILETNDQLLARAQALNSEAQGFCGDPTLDKLDAVRSTWIGVKQPLKEMEAFSFGPYRTFPIEMHKNVDKWPGMKEEIEAVLSSGDEIDQAYVEGLPYEERTKGYPAIGYLLYGEHDGMSTIELYQDEDGGDRRCTYLTTLTEHGLGVVQAYHTKWNPNGGDYVSDFTQAGKGSTTFTTQQAAIERMVSTMLFVTNEITMMKLGNPVGEGNGGEPLPGMVEAPYSQMSLEHIQYNLDGLEALYLGGEGLGLSDYIQFRSATGDVDARVKERIEAARSAVSAIEGPLKEAVVENPEQVRAAIDAVDQLKAVLSGDVSTLLGINPTTVQGDND